MTRSIVFPKYQCLYRTENPVVWDSHSYLFTCFSDAGAMGMVRSYERGRRSHSKLEDALGVMGMEGCAWMLKWGGGTAFARLSLESRYGLRLIKTLLESTLNWTETKSHFQTSQRIDYTPLESTLLRATLISTISKSHESTLKGSGVDS
ncbi:hypothetical protein PIB30_051549 [Stylosanthes scabra]|uniref:Uncharacterized protein n=1 Tax=Stylosanthes scabra TaxID=79078 RepID=A0ABU6XIU7_9FABA|nr:hypothetical protein [Stylosanthes scabra]